jgi:hypothetical protein
MALDVAARADAGRPGPADPDWWSGWLTVARRAWPVLTALAITANLLVLPEYTRSLVTRTIRAELPAAHLTPAGTWPYRSASRPSSCWSAWPLPR